jgi:NADPH:quinone reductase-like Zn-dependent oxidoreductase
MNAAVLRAIGQPPRYEQFTEPSAERDEVIVQVRAAALKPVDRQIADGSHYARPRKLPAVCGIDGVGILEGGKRVYFAGARPPHGAMAERTVVSRHYCFPLPADVDDVTAAALMNPAVSAWLTLATRAKLMPGETVLVLGATGVTGKLAVQIAKLLGAGRVVGAGRSLTVLNTLRSLGCDAIICISQPEQDLKESFTREAGETGFNVIIDYLWGHPTELLLNAMTQKGFVDIKSEARLVQVGESAGANISLPAAVLRSCALTILGTAGIPPRDALLDAFQQVLTHAARGELRTDVKPIPLADVGNAWQSQEHGCRLVLVP